MNNEERRQFMADWKEAALPWVRARIADLVPDLEVDGGPATAVEAAAVLRHMFATNFDQYWRQAVPRHIARDISEEEKATALEVILRILDQEIAVRGH